MKNYVIRALWLFLIFIVGLLSSANAGSTGDSLKIGVLPDTQGKGASVSIYPMQAVLDKFSEQNVDIVIPVGDLTNLGTTEEFEQWTSIAETYRKGGIEFLPLMGNHETAWGSDVEWVEYMKEFIPEDAVHMSGVEFGNYYVVRNNVLIILLKFGNLSPAFEWVKTVVEDNKVNVDHIIMASHDGLVGSKNGQTKGMISSKGTDILFDQWNEIKAFYAKHDIIWVQGHDHIYQRSVISAPAWVNPSSWSRSDGNYRLHQFTQIISGNASYKGYEFRFGEREKTQDIIQMKMNTMKNGSVAYDVNASFFSFNSDRVDYKSYVTTHTINDNQDGLKELSDPGWILLDQFSRSNNRCERIVYPSSIPHETRTSSTLDPRFHTNDCYADDGSKAKIIDGMNNTFNRYDSTREIASWNEGFSRAENLRDMARLMYQYMFQFHQPWSPNLNGNQRIQLDEENSQIIIPETTIDTKKHLTLSWLPKSNQTVSDIILVNGTQTHTGIYSNAHGMLKDIEEEQGLPGSQPDGTAKKPHKLPESATKSWDNEKAVSDPYVLQFKGESIQSEGVTLGYKVDETWAPITLGECVQNMAYETGTIDQYKTLVNENCEGKPVVGYDDEMNQWWVVLTSDAEVALIEK